MPYIAPEVVTEAKRMDLLTYLRTYEPGQLVRVSVNTYCTREHDSLKISNGKWMWWSRGIGGRTALDYLIKVKELSFIEAVETIMGNCAVTAPVYETESRSYENQPLLLPQKSPTSNVVTQYLFGRGIDYEIINECLDKELIIESLPYHNVVFIGYDDKKEAKYAAYRATNNSRIKRTIKKQFWLSRSEAQDLQKKAKKACLSEAGLIRLLLKGYEPREKPDADFYEAMKELSAIGNNINQLAVKANSLGFVDAPQLKKEAERWHKFQADMERIYLRPDKSELKWQ